MPVVNKTALNQKIAEAEALQEEDYTVETWTSFTVALWNAKTVASRLFATQEEVNNALANLTAKMEALEEKPVVVDKTALNEKIVAAELLDIADYTEATWGPFATALANAKLVAAHSDATQQEVNNALAELIAKMAALIEKPQVTVYTVADLEGEVNKDEAGVWEVIILGTKARVAFPELTASDELLITLADGRSYELDYIQFADEYINLNIQDANLSVEVLESAVVTVLMPR